MLKLRTTTGLALLLVAIVVVVTAEPPKEVVVHHHHHHTMHSGPPPPAGAREGGEHHHHQQQHGHGRPVKIRQGGPSKIFGWLGSRFAKIPHYLPRMPQFPRLPPQHKLPSYQAIIMPDPPKLTGHGKLRGPEKVKITKHKPAGSYHDLPGAIPEISENSYSPSPVSSSYSVPESAPQIEVVQSTLLYQNNQVIPTVGHIVQPASVSLPAPAPVTQTAAPLSPPPVASYESQSSRPSSGARKPIKPGTPIVPQSTGPDYFDTAYKGGSSYKEAQAAQQAHQQQQQQIHALLGLGTPENNYGAKFEIQAQGVPQAVIDPTLALALQPQLVQQQAYVQAPAAQQVYQAPQQQAYQTSQQTYQQAPQPQQGHAQATQIEQYANQALNTQSLDSLISSIADSAMANNVNGNNYGAYSQLSPQVAAPPSQQATGESQQQEQSVRAPSSYQKQQQQRYQQQQQSSESGIPGVQILSSGTDGGNPVFEVIADANAPSYNGHPFDINKLISLIEPGAELDSAELSHAASETKQTYSVPVQVPTSSPATTSGTSETLTNNNNSSISISNSTKSSTEITNATTISSKTDSKLPTGASSNSTSTRVSVAMTVTGKTSNGTELKDIMDFFQQTGGKGYVVVEKKRHRPDNLTLDFDQSSDDDLTNGPTRVNITSDMIFSQLELLQFDTSITSSTTQRSSSTPTSSDFDSPPEDILHTPLLPEYTNTDLYELNNNEDESLYNYYDTNSSSNNRTNVQENLIPDNTDKERKTEKGSEAVQNVTTTPSSVRPTPLDTLSTPFEPVTSGKAAVFVTTTLPDGETLNPNHNYYGSPSSTLANFSTEYPIVGHAAKSAPTINPFLDSVDESVLDEPVTAEEGEEEGDLSVAESQQVSSIAITVTPPPRSQVEGGKKGKGTATTTAGTTTTTQKPTEIDPVQLLAAAATKKPTTDSKSRPAPVYRGKKSN